MTTGWRGLLGAIGGSLAMISLSCAAVPTQRLEILSRGINLDTSVFEHPKPPAALANDLALIQHAGLRHVRIFVSQEDWFNGRAASNWRIARLDMVVQAAVHAHLGVILCLASKRWPLTDAATDVTIDNWLTSWRRLAEHYRAVPPDLMYFEVANEPGMNGTRWSGVQEQLRAAIRQQAPANTLLLTPSPLSMVWSLPTMTVSRDTDVVYIFHLYQPMVFSHQGAGWANPAYQQITGLLYPPDAANIRSIMARPLVAANPDAVKDLQQYGSVGGSMMGTEIAKARQWAQEHDVHVVVTEFGSYASAPQASRAAWLGAARQGFEAAGFGWTVWQYEGGFEIKTDLQKGCDAVTRALGLCE